MAATDATAVHPRTTTESFRRRMLRADEPVVDPISPPGDRAWYPVPDGWGKPVSIPRPARGHGDVLFSPSVDYRRRETPAM